MGKIENGPINLLEDVPYEEKYDTGIFSKKWVVRLRIEFISEDLNFDELPGTDVNVKRKSRIL